MTATAVDLPARRAAWAAWWRAALLEVADEETAPGGLIPDAVVSSGGTPVKNHPMPMVKDTPSAVSDAT
jgi:hypothetical protein